jgi:hypothetical protein
VARKIQETLNAEANEAAEKLMVRAKQNTPEGARARAELRNKVEKNPGAFKAGFLKDIEEADPAERKKQEAIEAQGAVNAKAIEKRMAEVDAQAGFEAGGRANERAYAAKQKAKQDQAADRYAGSMEGGAIGRELLAKPELDDTQLEDRIKTAMAKAGVAADEIGELAPAIAKKLREKLDKDVERRALDRGIGDVEARKQLSKEAEKAAKAERTKDAGPLQVMNDKQYFDKLLTASLNAADLGVPKEQLAEAKATNKTLKEIQKGLAKPARPGPALFGRGGPPR